jgi:hypothetical protein
MQRRFQWLKQPTVDSNCFPISLIQETWPLLTFSCFQILNSKLCGRHFGSDDDVIHAVEAQLQAQDTPFCQEGNGMLERWWTKCIGVRGEYFKKYTKIIFVLQCFLGEAENFLITPRI